jgi:hypothetical protein
MQQRREQVRLGLVHRDRVSDDVRRSNHQPRSHDLCSFGRDVKVAPAAGRVRPISTPWPGASAHDAIVKPINMKRLPLGKFGLQAPVGAAIALTAAQDAALGRPISSGP